MIAIDSSALICVVGGEAPASQCERCLLSGDLLISAATLVEVRIVALKQGIAAEVEEFLQSLDLEVVPVDEAFAGLAASGYAKWGKGFHRARLNYGDSFSYALAKMYDCPLLYVGDDFARTDVRNALA